MMSSNIRELMIGEDVYMRGIINCQPHCNNDCVSHLDTTVFQVGQSQITISRISRAEGAPVILLMTNLNCRWKRKAPNPRVQNQQVAYLPQKWPGVSRVDHRCYEITIFCFLLQTDAAQSICLCKNLQMIAKQEADRVLASRWWWNKPWK